MMRLTAIEDASRKVGLEDWWLSTFSPSERRYIELKRFEEWYFGRRELQMFSEEDIEYYGQKIASELNSNADSLVKEVFGSDSLPFFQELREEMAQKIIESNKSTSCKNPQNESNNPDELLEDEDEQDFEIDFLFDDDDNEYDLEDDNLKTLSPEELELIEQAVTAYIT